MFYLCLACVLGVVFGVSAAVALEFVNFFDAVGEDGEDDWGTNYDGDKCHGGAASSFEFRVGEYYEDKD